MFKHITPRGWFVFGFATALALIGAEYVLSHIWFVGTHYCWGTFEHCYYGGK